LHERKIEACTLGDAGRFQLVMLNLVWSFWMRIPWTVRNAQRLSWAWWKLRLLSIPSILFSDDFLESFIPGGFFAQWLFDHIQHIVVQCHHIVAGHDYHMGSLCIIPEDTSTTLFPQIHLRCAIMQLCSSNSLSSQLGVALGTDGGNCHVLYLAWHHSFVHRPRKLSECKSCPTFCILQILAFLSSN
jgi:hypothetical protein